MRYTEAKLSPIGDLMMDDIGKNTIDMIPNYDDSEEEASVLPGLFPFLLADGGTGIAVGVASSFVPHKVSDVYKALDLMLENAMIDKDTPIDDLINIIQAPDFPTGGTIINISDVHAAYKGERTSVKIRGKYHTETEKNKTLIVFTEIPYHTNKARIVESIFTGIKDDAFPDVKSVKDESDRTGIRIVVEMKPGGDVSLTLNRLFKQTALQSSVSMNHVALVNGVPKTNLTLKELLEQFLGHAIEVVRRRIQFDYDKSIKRAHILSGYVKAISSLDDTLTVIREAKNKASAVEGIISLLSVDEEQAKAIVELKLYSLTQEDISTLEKNAADEIKESERLNIILTDDVALLRETQHSLNVVASRFEKEERLTDIDLSAADFSSTERDLIKQEDIVIYFTYNNMVKAVRLDECEAQGRAGKGSMLKTKEDDFVEHILTLSNKDDLVFITNLGKAYTLAAYKIPVQTKASVAKYLNNYITFEEGETVKKVFSISEKDRDNSIFIVTKKGMSKRMLVSELPKLSIGGKIMTFREEGDEVVDCIPVQEGGSILAITREGLGLRVDIDSVRTMGRAASGVRLMKFKKPDDCIVNVIHGANNDCAIFVSEKGMGKRMLLQGVNPHRRAGLGMLVYKVNKKTGPVVAACRIEEEDTLIIVTKNGKVIRFPAKAIGINGRQASGVKMINLQDNDTVLSVSAAPGETEKVEENDNGSGGE